MNYVDVDEPMFSYRQTQSATYSRVQQTRVTVSQ